MQPPIDCYCGAQAHLKSSLEYYGGKLYGNGMRYICDRYPACRGSVGTHPDMRPLGTIPDPETVRLRMQLHSLVDPLWRGADNGRSKKHNRGSVYGWLRRITGLNGEQCHIGMFDKQQCVRTIELIAQNPYENKHK